MAHSYLLGTRMCHSLRNTTLGMRFPVHIIRSESHIGHLLACPMCHSLRTNDGELRSRSNRPHDRVGAVPPPTGTPATRSRSMGSAFRDAAAALPRTEWHIRTF